MGCINVIMIMGKGGASSTYLDYKSYNQQSFGRIFIGDGDVGR